MKPSLLDPCNDVVFKRLFGPSPLLLSDLVNAVRNEEAPTQISRILNPQIDPNHIRDKFVVLDLLARDTLDNYLNIEMQVQPRGLWSQRGMVYLAKTLAGQLGTGAPYADLKPVIGIHLLRFDLFASPTEADWCYQMRDRRNPAMCLGSELQLHVLELKKAARLILAGNLPPDSPLRHPALRDWILWLTHWKDDAIMNQITHPAVIEAAQRLDALSANEEMRLLADAREMALLTERLDLTAAERRGIAIGEARGEERGIAKGEERGIAIGEEKGIAKGMEQAVRNLVAGGMSEAQARHLVGLA